MLEYALCIKRINLSCPLVLVPEHRYQQFKLKNYLKFYKAREIIQLQKSEGME